MCDLVGNNVAIVREGADSPQLVIDVHHAGKLVTTDRDRRVYNIELGKWIGAELIRKHAKGSRNHL